VHLVSFIIRIYHDARSSECQIRFIQFQCSFVRAKRITVIAVLAGTNLGGDQEAEKVIESRNVTRKRTAVQRTCVTG
jgi:hypothetical protein